MTLPSDFRTTDKVVGSSAITHPIYVFSVDLSRLKSESIGPKTNSRSVNLLHPDMSNQSADYGRTLMSGHDSVKKHTWWPGFLRGSNIDMNDDGTITAYGQQAVYLKTRYADSENPVLTLINRPPYTSTSLNVTYASPVNGGISGGGTATVQFTDV